MNGRMAMRKNSADPKGKAKGSDFQSTQKMYAIEGIDKLLRKSEK